METKRQQVYAIIAGVCFILLGVGLYDGPTIMTIIEYGVSVYDFFGALRTACSIVSGVFWIIGKKKFPFLLTTCMHCITQITHYLIRLLMLRLSTSYSLSFFDWYWIIFRLVAFLSFFIVIGVTYIPAAMEKPKSHAKCLAYFVPALFSLLVLLIDLLYSDWAFLISFDFYEDVLTILALFTSCLWLKERNTPIFQKKASAPAPAAPLIGRAERLQQYKDLLDAGVLTQAEFDAKKAEILHP